MTPDWKRKAIDLLERLTQRAARDYSTTDFGRERNPDCVSVIVPEFPGLPMWLERLRRALPPGLIAFLGTNEWRGVERHDGEEIVVGPGRSTLDAVRHARTRAPESGLDTAAIVSALERLDAMAALDVWHADANTVEFDLRTRPSDPEGFARAICDLCPGIVEQVPGGLRGLVRRVARRESVSLWWPDEGDNEARPEPSPELIEVTAAELASMEARIANQPGRVSVKGLADFSYAQTNRLRYLLSHRDLGEDAVLDGETMNVDTLLDRLVTVLDREQPGYRVRDPYGLSAEERRRLEELMLDGAKDLFYVDGDEDPINSDILFDRYDEALYEFDDEDGPEYFDEDGPEDGHERFDEDTSAAVTIPAALQAVMNRLSARASDALVRGEPLPPGVFLTNERGRRVPTPMPVERGPEAPPVRIDVRARRRIESGGSAVAMSASDEVVWLAYDVPDGVAVERDGVRVAHLEVRGRAAGVRIAATGDRALLVWLAPPDGRLQAAPVSPGGVGPVRTLATAATAVPTVAAGPEGDFVVGWTTRDAAFVQRLYDDGEPIAEPVPMPAWDGRHAPVALPGQGSLLALWHEPPAPWGPGLRAGDPRDPARSHVLGPAPVWRTGLLSLGARLLAVWAGRRHDQDIAVWARRLDAAGAPVEDPVDLKAPLGRSFAHHHAFAGDGQRAAVLWCLDEPDHFAERQRTLVLAVVDAECNHAPTPLEDLSDVAPGGAPCDAAVAIAEDRIRYAWRDREAVHVVDGLLSVGAANDGRTE